MALSAYTAWLHEHTFKIEAPKQPKRKNCSRRKSDTTEKLRNDPIHTNVCGLVAF